ncbi:LysR family transcriptional regulator [Fulvimarina sp. 2208YS6-2-32]|uniref:LysR family transcriptional regulator n=1 Tax=Fulvimarina uroteuthidis TaxID=3098149 RepID=A0ABU5HYB5_9HYPH|nr:LysR family transcriptional regulator [Fulvimarina sp. 2208YS6-2-32]MDY8107574.1 LysR family transcriptional regulator [Fulvimarina sp. 2208YS6-2-32]
MIDKLEYLIMLSHERHFGRAADKLGITQPTLSAGIRQLEERLGVTLVNRGSRYKGMTSEGERVLAWARKITDDVRTMREEVRSVRRGLSGHLRIGAIPTALSLVPRLTTPFRERHPDVTFDVTSFSSLDLLAAVENFEIDVGLTYHEDDRVRRVDARPLFEERYSFITTRGHPLADRDRISWQEANAVPLCLLSPSMQNRRILNRHLGEKSAVLETVMESNSMMAILAQVRMAGLATIMPHHVATMLGLGDPLVAIPLDDPDVTYTIALVTARRDLRPPIVAAFWSEASEQADPVG